MKSLKQFFLLIFSKFFWNQVLFKRLDREAKRVGLPIREVDIYIYENQSGLFMGVKEISQNSCLASYTLPASEINLALERLMSRFHVPMNMQAVYKINFSFKQFLKYEILTSTRMKELCASPIYITEPDIMFDSKRINAVKMLAENNEIF